MRRRAQFIWMILVPLAVALGAVVYWQWSKFSMGLKTVPMDGTTELLVGALSTQVLAPGVDGAVSQSSAREPLLDQYRKNPEAIRQRYRLVMTWVHASEIFKAIGQNPSFKDEIVSSASLSNIPAADSADGWGNPYCIFADADQMTFLSSGGDAALSCGSLRQTAKHAASTSKDSRLSKDGNLLVAVYRRGEYVPTTRLE
ncbi:MAG: hypothetical protein WBQ94_10940 [Terracidiphilus sp.]